MCPVCAVIMHIKGIAGAAYSGRTKSTERIPTLLHHRLIAPRQQLTDTLHFITEIKGRLFIISAQLCTLMWTQGMHVDLYLYLFRHFTNKTSILCEHHRSKNVSKIANLTVLDRQHRKIHGEQVAEIRQNLISHFTLSE